MKYQKPEWQLEAGSISRSIPRGAHVKMPVITKTFWVNIIVMR